MTITKEKVKEYNKGYRDTHKEKINAGKRRRYLEAKLKKIGEIKPVIQPDKRESRKYKIYHAFKKGQRVFTLKTGMIKIKNIIHKTDEGGNYEIIILDNNEAFLADGRGNSGDIHPSLFTEDQGICILQALTMDTKLFGL